MTPQQTPDIDAPYGLVTGAIIRSEGGLKTDRWDIGHEVWQVRSAKYEQMEGDNSPRLYVKLQSVLRLDGLAFITVPFDENTMQVSPPPDQTPAAGVMFPEPGSQVYIRESNDPSRRSFRDGLWEVGKAFHKPIEDGAGQVLQLHLKSLDRINPSYMNVAFNRATMKPVMPAHLANGGMVDVDIKRDIQPMKPLNIQKRNAAP